MSGFRCQGHIPSAGHRPRMPAGLRREEQKRDLFYDSGEWQRLRYRTIMKYGAHCQCCGARGNCDNPIQVDHIKPRSKYPDLQLDPNNLQVLCKDCNRGKGAWDETDWRPR